MLSGELYDKISSHKEAFYKVLFFTAVATGVRASQLRTFSRHAQWTLFTAGNDRISLIPYS